MTRKTIPAVVAAVALSAGLLVAAFVLSGCSASTLDDDYSGPSDQELYQESAEIQQEQEQEQETEPDSRLQPWKPGSEPTWCSEKSSKSDSGFDWRKSKLLTAECEGVEPNFGEEEAQYSGDDFESRCDYDPTYNNDWHDDMVCDGQRLYLLPDDNYVEYAELEHAARKWIANQ